MNPNNFQWYRGDSLPLLISFTNSDGTPTNITGWTLFFTLKQFENDDDSLALIQKTVTTHSNPTGGQSLITIPSSSTGILGVFPYDVQYKDTAGLILTVVRGTIEFIQDITVKSA